MFLFFRYSTSTSYSSLSPASSAHCSTFLLTLPLRAAIDAGRGRVGDGVLGVGGGELSRRRRSLRDRDEMLDLLELLVDDGS